jgi:hypothetical protein
MIDLAKQHTAELINEADKQRLAMRLRRGKHRRPPDNRAAGARAERQTRSTIESATDRVVSARIGAAGSVSPAGRLGSWEEQPEKLGAGQAR